MRISRRKAFVGSSNFPPGQGSDRLTMTVNSRSFGAQDAGRMPDGVYAWPRREQGEGDLMAAVLVRSALFGYNPGLSLSCARLSMCRAHPSVVGRIILTFTHSAMVPRWIAVLACTMALVQGCALPVPGANGIVPDRSSWSVGVVTTKDDRPLVLSAPDQTIRIVPGVMKLTPVSPSVWYLSDYAAASVLPAEFLYIENGGSRLRIKLHAGELTEKGLQIIGATHGLSANIIGDWRDETLKDSRYSQTERCTKRCTRNVERETCDKGACKKETVTETYDCGYGNHSRNIRESQYLRHYQVRFTDTQKSTDSLAQLKAADRYDEHVTGDWSECR